MDVKSGKANLFIQAQQAASRELKIRQETKTSVRNFVLTLIVLLSAFVGRGIAQQGPGGEIPGTLRDALQTTASRRAAEDRIKLKWDELGGAPGQQSVPGESGLMVIRDGYYREYVGGGRIYYRPTDKKAFFVYGYIHEKYRQLGGSASRLGWPTSDEQTFTEDGRVTNFEGGTIYWWRDTGAFELSNIVVRYKGLYCFGETDNDQLSESDEPYVIFGVVPPPIIQDGKATVQTSAPRTDIYTRVDAGDSRADNIEFYRGLPYGMSLSTTLFEHDFSDPDEYRGVVKALADKAAGGLVVAAEKVPYVGPALAVIADKVWTVIGDDVVGEIHEALDTKDDNIDTKSVVITAKQMVTLARVARQKQGDVEWNLESPLLSGDGSSYKVYFSIEAVEPPVVAVAEEIAEGPQQFIGTFETTPANYQPMWVYAIKNDGDLVWYRKDSGESAWQGPKKVGNGWNFKDVIPAGGNSLYALTEDGKLMWYQHTGFNDGTINWKAPAEVGHGWTFTKIFSGGEGIIYAITQEGKLLWHKHNGYMTGAGLETPGAWGSTKEVGRGWNGFQQVFSGGGGIIYAITQDGKLRWYKHNGYLSGAGLETPGAWEGPKEVGRGWNGFQQIVPAGDGVILVIQNDGKLRWYKHNGYMTGVGLETPGAWEGPKEVGTGWQSFRKVFALLPASSAPVVR
ncbi:hypothetical protein L0222_22380 [bacterium]|nr:hypothetical protein [bacterium]MCI0605515.1 hypothetical protein [bacterium]